MDLIKHEFRGYVRPYYDAPDIRVPVQWYFANPNAIQMPYVSAFANVIGRTPGFRPNVGMDWSFKPNNVGNAGGYLGIAPCGGPDAWLNGVSFFNPAPACRCRRERLIRIAEVPVGAINGTNRTFVTSQLPYSNSVLDLYLNGVHQDEGVTYSLTQQTIYIAAGSIPLMGDDVYVTYWVPT